MKNNKNRYNKLDGIRGFAVLNMILYHAAWDAVYMFGVDWKWFASYIGNIWQMCICCSFIALSGFCVPLSRHKLRNGMIVFLSGCLITLVTVKLMPENKIYFGVLTLIGSCMLLSIPFEKLLQRVNPYVGIVLAVALYVVSRDINRGYLSFCRLPDVLYRNMATAYLGFPPHTFSSVDYFPLLPWLFVFVSGYFLYRIFKHIGIMPRLKKSRCAKLEWLGRHSLIIYLVHQPVVYAILWCIFSL